MKLLTSYLYCNYLISSLTSINYITPKILPTQKSLSIAKPTMRRFLMTTSNKEVNEPVVKKQKINSEIPKKIDNDDELIISLSAHQSLLSPEERSSASNLSEGWTIKDNILVKIMSSKDRVIQGVYSFDMDGTLITTKSGKKFPINDNDWKLLDSSIPSKIKSLYDDNYAIAIISNQNGLDQGKSDVSLFQKKIDVIIDTLGVPVDFICSMKHDIFRKPRTGMWDLLYERLWKDHIGNIHEKCYYIGDAAGRPAYGTRGKDFADTDLKFARNLGIKFETPEVLFLGSKMKIHTDFPLVLTPVTKLSDFEVSKSQESIAFLEEVFAPISDSPEIVILVAAPASGKSTLARKFTEKGYTRVNQDELKTLPKCLAFAKDAILQGKSVVIDNTNPNFSVRSQWVSLAKDVDCPIRAIVIDLPKELCMLLSTYRLCDPRTPVEDRRKIETVVFHKYFKDMTHPSIQEGFNKIQKLNWDPIQPSSEHPISKQLFSMYLK